MDLGSENPTNELRDQQTRKGESDIVRNLGPNTGVKNVLWIGLDADAKRMASNAAIVTGTGVDNAGEVDRIKDFDNGSDLNTSPPTTSIIDPARGSAAALRPGAERRHASASRGRHLHPEQLALLASGVLIAISSRKARDEIQHHLPAFALQSSQ